MYLLRVVGLWLVLQVGLLAWLLWQPSGRDLSTLIARSPQTVSEPSIEERITVFIALQRPSTTRMAGSQSLEASRRRGYANWGLGRGLSENRYFLRRAKQSAQRFAIGRFFKSEDLVLAVSTGRELLDALATASLRGPISNVVVYGHSGPDGLYMLDDAGFYADLNAIPIGNAQSGATSRTSAERRQTGARDVSDLVDMIRSGQVVLSIDVVFVLAGCSAAGEHNLDVESIASKLAHATNGRVVASVGQTMNWATFGGPDYGEYSLNHWAEVRNGVQETPYGRGLDPIRHLNWRIIDRLE